MARFKRNLSLLALSAALVHCSKRESSESRAEPGSPAATTTANEKMTPASRSLTADEPRARQAADTARAEAMGATAEALSDAQIVKLMDLANSAEVEEGKIAETKAKGSKVKNFASMMVMHHGQAKQKGDKLATKLALTPAESPLSTKMKSESESSLAQLKGTPAKDFDRAYIDGQVKEHKKVLSTLDDKLIPAAKDSELKSLLREMRTTVQSHLSEAQQIASDMQGAPETP